MDDIPQWARERACELSHEAARENGRPNSGGLTPRNVVGTDSGRALARYIADHEEPPVDPLESEVENLVTEWRLGPPSSGEKLALAALKRGMELARESKPYRGNLL